MIVSQAAQEIEVLVAPQDNIIIIVAGRHRAADHQKQHLAQRIHHLARLAGVLDLRKMLQKARAAQRGGFVHGFLPNERKPFPSHQPITCHKSTQPVNLNSLPCLAVPALTRPRPKAKTPRSCIKALLGGSSNGRTADSDSASLGSNPSPPTNSNEINSLHQ